MLGGVLAVNRCNDVLDLQGPYMERVIYFGQTKSVVKGVSIAELNGKYVNAVFSFVDTHRLCLNNIAQGLIR